jgi:hypothetical protein
MIRVGFFLARQQLKQLAIINKKTGLSKSEITRRAIDLLYEKFLSKRKI